VYHPHRPPSPVSRDVCGILCVGGWTALALTLSLLRSLDVRIDIFYAATAAALGNVARYRHLPAWCSLGAASHSRGPCRRVRGAAGDAATRTYAAT
jgi:hypothetical protein